MKVLKLLVCAQLFGDLSRQRGRTRGAGIKTQWKLNTLDCGGLVCEVRPDGTAAIRRGAVAQLAGIIPAPRPDSAVCEKCQAVLISGNDGQKMEQQKMEHGLPVEPRMTPLPEWKPWLSCIERCIREASRTGEARRPEGEKGGRDKANSRGPAHGRWQMC